MEHDCTSWDSLDCTVVHYIKQLSPSDAASSKQIKLPKTEARRFCGDLRHKQRSMVTVLDHHHVFWEFLCTCYGCQYALSRVAVFCNTYQLRAGQYLMFYRDTKRRLRIAVTGSVPANLLQQVGHSSSSHQKRTYSRLLAAQSTAQDRQAKAAAEEVEAVAAAAGKGVFVGQIFLAPTDEVRAQQQQLMTVAAVDAVSHGCRDQGCAQTEQPQLLQQQQQEQQCCVAVAWDEKQQQQPHRKSSDAMATLPEAAAASYGACTQEQGSQNSSESSSSRQVLSVCPDMQQLSSSSIFAGTSLTPTSTAVGNFMDTPAWAELLMQQQQQPDQATLPGNRTAAARFRLPAAVAHAERAATACVTQSGSTAAAAALREPRSTVGGWNTAAKAAAAGVPSKMHVFQPFEDKAAAGGVTAAAGTDIGAAATAVCKATYSPGSCLVCHEQLLDSPPSAATQLPVKVRAQQRDSSQTERLKLRWRAVNNAATAAGGRGALDVPSNMAASGSSCGYSKLQGKDQAMPAVPGAVQSRVLSPASYDTAELAERCVQATQEMMYVEGSSMRCSGKQCMMDACTADRRLISTPCDPSKGSKAICSTNSSALVQAALLPKLHFIQQQRHQQQQQQFLGRSAASHNRTSVALADCNAAPVRLEKATSLTVPGWGPDKQYTVPGWSPDKQYTSQDVPAWGPDKQYTSQDVPAWGPDKQYTSQKMPAWSPDKQYTSQNAPSTALKPCSVQNLHTTVGSSSGMACQAAAAAGADSVTATAQPALTGDPAGCGFIGGASGKWQLGHNASCSDTAGWSVGPSIKKRKVCGGSAAESHRLGAAALQQVDSPAAAAAATVAVASQSNRQQAGPFAADRKVTLLPGQLVGGYSGQQQQQSASAGDLYSGIDTHTWPRSMLAKPLCFSISGISGGSKASGTQQDMLTMQQKPLCSAVSDHARSHQLLPLFQSLPRSAAPGSATMQLRQGAAPHGSGTSSHTLLTQQQHLAGCGGARQLHTHGLHTLPSQQQQQQQLQLQPVFETDEWSAASGLLMLAHCSR